MKEKTKLISDLESLKCEKSLKLTKKERK